MRRYALAVLVSAAASMSAAQDAIVQVMTDDGNGNVRVMTSEGAPGGIANYVHSSANSPLNIFGAGGHHSTWLYSGKVPQKYLVLGLTDEQKKKLEDLCTSARNEYQEASKAMYQGHKAGQRFDAEQMRERSRKFNETREEITKKYGDRMSDVLTDQQRTTLAKMEEIIESWRAEEAAIRKAMDLALQQNRENFEAKLDGMLTDEQRAALKELQDAKPQWQGIGHRRGKPGRSESGAAPPNPSKAKEVF